MSNSSTLRLFALAAITLLGCVLVGVGCGGSTEQEDKAAALDALEKGLLKEGVPGALVDCIVRHMDTLDNAALQRKSERLSDEGLKTEEEVVVALLEHEIARDTRVCVPRLVASGRLTPAEIKSGTAWGQH